MDKKEKLDVYRALIIPAYLKGAMTALKHWERWRVQPKDSLMAHIKKLAEEEAEKVMLEIESKTVEETNGNNS